MRKIAIIQFKEVDIDYDEYDIKRMIATKITDWVEVDDETYTALFYFQAQGKYRIVELLPHQEQFILDTVEHYKEYVRSQQAILDKIKKEKQEKHRQKQITKHAKTVEEKKQMLEQLKKELGVE
jgi:alpha-D-ribose 1-methylphosphonate 5-triphosphate diphosphatase PhnM